MFIRALGAIEAIPTGKPRKMFGWDGVSVNGNFAAGLWRNTDVFKLSAADGRPNHREVGAIPFAPMKGPVDEGLVLPNKPLTLRSRRVLR
jgi:hypothetical protein